MRFFDFHSHPILKQLFNDIPNIDSLIYKDDVSPIANLCTDLPNIVESQTHPSQLAGFRDEVIVGAALYSTEKYLASAVIELRTLLTKNSRFKLSQKVLEDIDKNEIKPFSDFLMERTLKNYIKSGSYNVLTKSSFNKALPNNKVNVFFTIEGCHSLVDHCNNCEGVNKYEPTEILQNLDKVQDKVKIVSVNLTHLQQSNLCNHAFGIQITDIKPFIPKGNGLTNDGRKVIQGLFDRGVCLDVKHMSYKSRKDVMREIDAGNYENVQPIVCTHTGFTGTSFNNWPGYIQKVRNMYGSVYLEHTKSLHTRNMPRRPGFPAFNGSTINLFDEEIAWIVKNDGIIGISLDRRILGYVGKNDERANGLDSNSDITVDREFFSPEEWIALGIKKSQIGAAIDLDDIMTMTELSECTEDSNPMKKEFFYDHILNHIKHYFQVCKNNGISISKAQKQIIIGSDFDGLINPFSNIATVQQMSDLKSYIRGNIIYFLQDLEDSKQWCGELDVNMFVEDLFYNNGFKFIKSRF